MQVLAYRIYMTENQQLSKVNNYRAVCKLVKKLNISSYLINEKGVLYRLLWLIVI